VPEPREHLVYVVARDARPEAPHDIIKMILERTEHVVSVEVPANHVTLVRVRASDFGQARGIVEGAVARADPDASEQFTYRPAPPSD
jgi:hypothetical protein